MEGPAGGDHLALRDVVKYDFSTGLFCLMTKRKRTWQWPLRIQRVHTTYTHGVKLIRFCFIFLSRGNINGEKYSHRLQRV